MKKLFQAFIAAVLLGSLTIQADPFKSIDYQKASQYTNGNPIPQNETLTETIRCGTTSGGPYPVEIAVTTPGAPPAIEDFGPCVNGTPGTYYIVAVHHSLLYGTTSEESNEANFTVTPGMLGFVPNPPQNLVVTQ